MTFGLKAEDISEIGSVFSSHPNVEQVFIFGSRAMGTYQSGSDIDLGVKGKNLTAHELLELTIELEDLGFLYTFDLIHYDTVREKKIREHIDRVGKEIYTKQ